MFDRNVTIIVYLYKKIKFEAREDLMRRAKNRRININYVFLKRKKIKNITR